jgi:hypothetical protein
VLYVPQEQDLHHDIFRARRARGGGGGIYHDADVAFLILTSRHESSPSFPAEWAGG